MWPLLLVCVPIVATLVTILHRRRKAYQNYKRSVLRNRNRHLKRCIYTMDKRIGCSRRHKYQLRKDIATLNSLAKSMAEKVEKNFLKYGIYSEFVPSVEGSGLFAGREIPARKEVCIYFGSIKLVNSTGSSRSFTMRYGKYMCCDQPLELEIDGKKTRHIAHNANRLNHSCCQANVRLVWRRTKKLHYLVAVTSQAILEGEQLLINYGKKYWLSREDETSAKKRGARLFYCSCGVPSWIPHELWPRAMWCPEKRCQEKEF